MAAARREIWREARYAIAVHQVPTRDGGVIERACIDHPGAVVIWAQDAAGRVAVIDNQRWTVGERLLELPAGTLHRGEEPAAGALRELAEETGLRAGALEPLGSYYLAPGSSNERMWAFLASALQPGPVALDGDEDLTTRWMTLAELDAAIAAGEVRNANALAVRCLVRAREGR